MENNPKTTLDYYNLTHKGLSYSRQLVLHQCPKKYELDAKKALKGRIESVTFSYGHAVGAAVQSTLEGKTFNRVIVDAVMAYTHDEYDEGTDSEKASKKSLWSALIAAEEFYKRYHAGMYSFLGGWELARFTDRNGIEIPAVELTFVLDIGEGYSYEGHIDVVLYHPGKNRYMVVELKTTGSNNVSEASYKNSAQALGYGAVVDLIASNIKASASYDVLYLVYKSRQRELVPMIHKKTPALRIDWINSLLTDVHIIELYEELGYPRHGESCYDFFRECEYYGQCTMSDEALDRMYNAGMDEEEAQKYSALIEPTFVFTLEELLARQEKLMALASSPNTTKADDADTPSDELDILLDVVQIKG